MRENNDREAPVPGKSSASGIAGDVRAFVKQMIELGEQARPLRRLLEPASVRAESPGGETAVVVTVGGALIAVDFAAGHEDVDEDELAAMVLDAYDRALAEVERRRLEGPDKDA